MLKMHHHGTHKGDTPELWEENWMQIDFEQALSFCDVDPLKPLFEKYATPETAMLEGGCGCGQYVAYLSKRGVRVTGLDFTFDTLRRLRQRNTDLMLCAGDVSRLPFRDGSFDLYYSGGVVEHFEGGPEPALKEARRVLRPGGILLISVPYFSPLRRQLYPFKTGLWRRVTHEKVDAEESPTEKQFFQYVYTKSEFKKKLESVGLRVIGTRGYSILWGLSDITLLQHLIERLSQRQSNTLRSNTPLPNEEQAQITLPQISDQRGVSASENHSKSWRSNFPVIKRLVVSEDDSVPVAGLVVRLMRNMFANMMMYECVRD